jgi:hypothetical protein
MFASVISIGAARGAPEITILLVDPFADRTADSQSKTPMRAKLRSAAVIAPSCSLPDYTRMLRKMHQVGPEKMRVVLRANRERWRNLMALLSGS